MSEKIILKPSMDYLCDTDKEIEPQKSYLCESGSNFVLNLTLTGEQIERGYHSGKCDDDVVALMEEPEIKEQLDKINDMVLGLWWDELYIDDTHIDHERASRTLRLAWLVFECCANAIDGYCYEMRQ